MFPGGLIALGIGIHRWDTEQCTAKFHEICRSGFITRTLAKTPLIGWISRWIQGSIYDTTALESSLRKAYPEYDLFGLSASSPQDGNLLHRPRVAVTTTVGSDCKLFTNYNAGSTGGDDYYLNSSLSTWEV